MGVHKRSPLSRRALFVCTSRTPGKSSYLSCVTLSVALPRHQPAVVQCAEKRAQRRRRPGLNNMRCNFYTGSTGQPKEALTGLPSSDSHGALQPGALGRHGESTPKSALFTAGGGPRAQTPAGSAHRPRGRGP